MIKKALITGTSSGIGQALGKKLLQQNIKIIGVCRKATEVFCKDINYNAYVCDLSDLQKTESVFKKITKEHPDIDAVIANAGSGLFGSLEQLSNQNIIKNINLNLIANILIIKALLPNLKKRLKGKIIVIGSSAGLEGGRQGTVYCSSKFALQGLVASLQKDCSATNIAITIINPDMIKTPFYDDIHFSPGKQKENSVAMDDVIDSILLVLKAQEGSLFDKINIKVAKKNIIKN
jgi:3-hydroxy acid dehydrogenase / malonic semialdehyde reductase